MFDYERFENDLVQQMPVVFNNWIEQNHDLYIFSLDCASGMDSIGAIANTIHYLEEQTDTDSEDYWYYKYCEEEWDLFDTFRTISEDMRNCLDENKGVFANPEALGEYSEMFDKHCNEIIKHCKNALIRFKKSISKNHSDVLLTFNIREYLDGTDRVKIFQSVNNESASKEYSEHIEDFA